MTTWTPVTEPVGLSMAQLDERYPMSGLSVAAALPMSELDEVLTTWTAVTEP